MELIQAIGGISGVIALLGFLWTIFFQMAKIKVRTDTLWEIYVVDALKTQHVEHSSAYKPKKEAEDLLPEDIKKRLGRIAQHQHHKRKKGSLGRLGEEVVKEIGIAKIEALAKENGLKASDVIGIMIAYVDQGET